jgi:hypothetical protein
MAKRALSTANAPASQRTWEQASCSTFLVLPGLSAQARTALGRWLRGAAAARRAAKALYSAAPANAAASAARTATGTAAREPGSAMVRDTRWGRKSVCAD